MESHLKAVTTHYTGQGNLAERILEALTAIGKDPDRLEPRDLAPVDEFHVRGKVATEEMAVKIGLNESHRVLDVGCGLGGAVRHLALNHGCRVTGLDLTPAYLEAAEVLSAKIGLGDQVQFRQGNALEMPFEDGAFDVVWSQHAAMNIEDRAGLYREMTRVLRPGGFMALYDILAGAGGAVLFPVPWARSPENSFLVTPDHWRELLESVGLEITHWRDVSEEGHQYFLNVNRVIKEKGLPPLGFHVLIGPEFSEMAKNQLSNLADGRIALIEVIGQKI